MVSMVEIRKELKMNQEKHALTLWNYAK